MVHCSGESGDFLILFVCVCVDVRDVKGEGDKGGGGALEISVTISSRKFVPSGQ